MLISLLLFACKTDTKTPIAKDSGVEEAEEIEDPWIPSTEPLQANCTEKDWADRFEDRAEEFGLTTEVHGITEICDFCAPRGAGLVAQDFNDDGFVDLIIGNLWKKPFYYQSDASGHFTEVDFPEIELNVFQIPEQERGIWNLSSTDLDSDGDWDLIFTSSGLAGYLENQDGEFQEPTFLYTEESTGAIGIYSTSSTADVNGDGRMDILLTSTRATGCFNCENPENREPIYMDQWKDVLLIQQDDLQFEAIELFTDPEGSNSHIGVFTDINRDGQVDIYVPKDNHGSLAFWENIGNDANGLPIFENNAEDYGLDIVCRGMGYDVGDINFDGEIDYCMSCLGVPFCMLNDGFGEYYEATQSLGFSIESYQSNQPSVGWASWIHDYNNDGIWDYTWVAGETDGEHDQYDMLWTGLENGQFLEQSFYAGIQDNRDNYGMLSHDFNGDHYLDLLTVGPRHKPSLLINKGGDCSWLEVEVDSEYTNAFIEVEAGGKTYIKEVLQNSGQTQNPNIVHFGLGDAGMVDAVRLVKGTEVLAEYEDIGAGQRVEFR